MSKTTNFMLEVTFVDHLLNDATKRAIIDAMIKAGREVRAKTMLIADPSVASCTFQQWTPEGMKDVPFEQDWE